MPNPCAPRPPHVTIGGLFAGVGGLELGTRAALAELGIETSIAWLVELDPYARSVLARHHPAAELREDITKIEPADLAPVDLITFGFPCQDLSNAGKKAGLKGARSGLFYEAINVVSHLRPAYFYVENVAAVVKELPEICRAVADVGGYDLAWCTLRASDVGAAHQRNRTFFLGQRHGATLAHPRCGSLQRRPDDRGVPEPQGEGTREGVQRQRGRDAARDVRPAPRGVADAMRAGQQGERPGQPHRGMLAAGGGPDLLADRAGGRRGQLWQQEHRDQQGAPGHESHGRDAGRRWHGPDDHQLGGEHAAPPQPGVGGMPDGVLPWLYVARPGLPQHPWEPPRLVTEAPHRTRRLKALGNAVVPAQATAAFLYLLAEMEALDP